MELGVPGKEDRMVWIMGVVLVLVVAFASFSIGRATGRATQLRNDQSDLDAASIRQIDLDGQLATMRRKFDEQEEMIADIRKWWVEHADILDPPKREMPKLVALSGGKFVTASPPKRPST